MGWVGVCMSLGWAGLEKGGGLLLLSLGKVGMDVGLMLLLLTDYRYMRVLVYWVEVLPFPIGLHTCRLTHALAPRDGAARILPRHRWVLLVSVPGSVDTFLAPKAVAGLTTSRAGKSSEDVGGVRTMSAPSRRPRHGSILRALHHGTGSRREERGARSCGSALNNKRFPLSYMSCPRRAGSLRRRDTDKSLVDTPSPHLVLHLINVHCRSPRSRRPGCCMAGGRQRLHSDLGSNKVNQR